MLDLTWAEGTVPVGAADLRVRWERRGQELSVRWQSQMPMDIILDTQALAASLGPGGRVTVSTP